MPKSKHTISRQKRRMVSKFRANAFKTNGTIIVCKLSKVNRLIININDNLN